MRPIDDIVVGCAGLMPAERLRIAREPHDAVMTYLNAANANTESRDQLMASRTRLVIAAAEARRRIVLDLHDGAQQRLVNTILTLTLAQQALQRNDGADNACWRSGGQRS